MLTRLPLALAAASAVAVLAGAAAPSRAAEASKPVPVTFRYAPQDAPGRVSLAGTFNGWKNDATPMHKGADGAWTATLDLLPGPYQYKFVEDGSRWVADPKAPAVPPDGNSALWVVPAGQSTEHKAGDGKLLDYAVQALDPVRVSRDEVRFRLRTAANDVERTALLVDRPVRRKGDSFIFSYAAEQPMWKVASDGLLDTYSATAHVNPKQPAQYRFALYDGDAAWGFGKDGVHPHTDRAVMTASSAEPFPLDMTTLPLFETPGWVRNTVWYQVFPERFWDGDKSNDPAPPKGVPDWNTPLSAVSGNPNDHWWGGDLQGVIDKLPYLKNLGVTGIYLNPIFEGPDTHFYATTDYLKVAPQLGDEATLKRLVQAAHKDGMRVMLDGVFNHTSVYFFAFQDILKNQEKSPYKDWYNIRSFPVLDPVTHYQGADERNIPYEGWWGIKWMPKLNTTNPATEAYLLKVATYWIKNVGIDGWRLDVANEVSPQFWKAFRKAVKGAKPDAYILGEIWDNASPWLQGDQFDAVMNYRFRGAALDFFAHGTSDAAQFAQSLAAIRADYPPQATAVMFNLLGSHDTARLSREAGDDPARVALATVFQMTYPGAPSVYYGDENGMTGGGDPQNRAPMVWDESRWDKGLHATFRRAIALRTAHPALRGLDIETLFAPEGARAVAFLRKGGGETAVTAFNASTQEQTLVIPAKNLPEAASWTDAWGGKTVPLQDGALTLALPPMSAAILFPDASRQRGR